MRKKIMAVVLSCLTIFALVASSFAVTFSASAVSVDEMTKAAVQIISRSEGTYGTINPNDNGAVSIACPFAQYINLAFAEHQNQ